MRFLGIPVVFPNFDARRAVLVAHNVHHLLSGYRTDWRGEAEIGGFAIAPRRTFAAFVGWVVVVVGVYVVVPALLLVWLLRWWLVA